MPSSPDSRRVWRILRLLAILAFFTGTWFLADMLEKRRLRFDGSFETRRSPGGIWWLDLRKTDPWIYAPQEFHVVIVPTEPGMFGLPRNPFLAFQFTLHNDGAAPGSHNIRTRWEGDSILHISTHAQDQIDTTYRVDLSGDRDGWRHDRLHALPGNLAFGLALWALLEWAIVAISRAGAPPSPSASPEGKGNPTP